MNGSTECLFCEKGLRGKKPFVTWRIMLEDPETGDELPWERMTFCNIECYNKWIWRTGRVRPGG